MVSKRDKVMAERISKLLQKEAETAKCPIVLEVKVEEVKPTVEKQAALQKEALLPMLAGLAGLGIAGKLGIDAYRRSQWGEDLPGKPLGQERLGYLQGKYQLQLAKQQQKMEDYWNKNYVQNDDGTWQGPNGTILGHKAYLARRGSMMRKAQQEAMRGLQGEFNKYRATARLDPYTGKMIIKAPDLPDTPAEQDFNTWKQKYLAPVNNPLQAFLPFSHRGSLYWRANNPFSLFTGRRSFNPSDPNSEQQLVDQYRSGQQTFLTGDKLWS